MKESIIQKKSYQFALRVIKMYKFLTKDQKEFILSKQVLRSSTLIGANVNEAQSAEFKNDFMEISLKESRETLYWLNLLHDSDFIEKDAFESIHKDCLELKNILSSIILSSKEKKNNSTL